MGPIAAYGRRGDWSLSFDSSDLHFPPHEPFIPVLVALFYQLVTNGKTRHAKTMYTEQAKHAMLL
jgi:hypothetical protein